MLHRKVRPMQQKEALHTVKKGCLIKKAVFSEKLWYYIKVYIGINMQEYLLCVLNMFRNSVRRMTDG